MTFSDGGVGNRACRRTSDVTRCRKAGTRRPWPSGIDLAATVTRAHICNLAVLGDAPSRPKPERTSPRAPEAGKLERRRVVAVPARGLAGPRVGLGGLAACGPALSRTRPGHPGAGELERGGHVVRLDLEHGRGGEHVGAAVGQVRLGDAAELRPEFLGEGVKERGESCAGTDVETFVYRGPVTNVPRPWMLVISPRSRSTCLARRIVP